MKKLTLLFLASLAIAIQFTPSVALAADCAAKAKKFAQKRNAVILNVASISGGKCEATVRIPGKNGRPPRVVTRTFKG